jgi:hypothetical protein
MKRALISLNRSLFTPSKVLFLLLAIDAIFILLNKIYLDTNLLSDQRFLLRLDRGYAEIFGYLMEGCIILVLCALAVRARQPLYFVWATLFLYILLDDFLMLHEIILGPSALAFLGLEWEDRVLGINAPDLVEDAAVALLALVILSIMLVVYHLGDRTFKKVSIGLFVLLAALAFFGVVVDLMHAAIRRSPSHREYADVSRLLGIIEDGGELVVVSLILWFVLLSWSRARQQEKEPKAQPDAR